MKADLGIYGQDAWTMGRLTLNLGGRYDYFHAAVPDQQEGPGPWVPFDRDFPGVDNVPKWRDWAVRMAGAYDLFGNGKTALKVAANRYLESMAAGFAAEFNPMTSKFELPRLGRLLTATSRFSTRTETISSTKCSAARPTSARTAPPGGPTMTCAAATTGSRAWRSSTS